MVYIYLRLWSITGNVNCSLKSSAVLLSFTQQITIQKEIKQTAALMTHVNNTRANSLN